MKKQILLTIAYLLIFLATWWCAFYLMLHNNLFDWHPKLDFYSIICTTLPFLFLFLAFKISQGLNRKITIAISAVSIVITGLFIYILFTDEVLNSSGFLVRDQLSPLWFKLLCGLLSALPVIGTIVQWCNCCKKKSIT